MIDYSSILKPMETAPTDGEVLMFGTSLKRPGEPLSAPDDVGVWAFCHRGASTWRDGMREFVPEGWVDLAEFAMEKQASAAAPDASNLRAPDLASAKTQAPDCEPIGFLSPLQAAKIADHDDASGVYLPIRKTAKGLFTMAIYAQPPAAPKRDPLTTDHKVAILCTWVAHIQAMDHQRDALEAVVGSYPESPLNDAIGDLQSGYTRAVAKLVGDAAEWLDWFRFDNQMGVAGMEAGPNGKLRPIKTVEDLVWFLETDK